MSKSNDGLDRYVINQYMRQMTPGLAQMLKTCEQGKVFTSEEITKSPQLIDLVHLGLVKPADAENAGTAYALTEAGMKTLETYQKKNGRINHQINWKTDMSW